MQLLKKRKPEAAVPIAEEYDEERPGIQLADGKAGLDSLLPGREIEHRRQAAMEKMTENERVAFVLRHMEGRSTEEIAAVLEVTPTQAAPGSLYDSTEISGQLRDPGSFAPDRRTRCSGLAR